MFGYIYIIFHCIIRLSFKKIDLICFICDSSGEIDSIFESLIIILPRKVVLRLTGSSIHINYTISSNPIPDRNCIMFPISNPASGIKYPPRYLNLL